MFKLSKKLLLLWVGETFFSRFYFRPVKKEVFLYNQLLPLLSEKQYSRTCSSCPKNARDFYYKQFSLEKFLNSQTKCFLSGIFGQLYTITYKSFLFIFWYCSNKYSPHIQDIHKNIFIILRTENVFVLLWKGKRFGIHSIFLVFFWYWAYHVTRGIYLSQTINKLCFVFLIAIKNSFFGAVPTTQELFLRTKDIHNTSNPQHIYHLENFIFFFVVKRKV